MTLTATQATTRGETKLAVIDCDIHNAIPSPKTLSKYLPERWLRHHEIFGMRGHSGANGP